MKNNLFQLKTTILGLLLIVAAGVNHFSLLYDNNVLTYSAFILGIAFLFFPDNIIGVIKRLIARKSEKL